MPLYEYQCDCGKRYEFFSKVRDMQSEVDCTCGSVAIKVFGATPTHFKSRGFPGNDSRKRYRGDHVVDNQVEDLFEDHQYGKKYGISK